MLNSKQLKMTRLAQHQIKALGTDVADYIRASEPSADVAADLRALLADVQGLASLLEFYAHGVEFLLWLKQKEETNG